MKKEALATGGLLGVSVLIASCCVAPALLLLFGVSISALGALSVLEPYQPIFIVLGGVLLAYAGVRIYRAAPVTASDACADGACAPDSRSRKLTRRFFVAAVTVYVVAIFYPFVLAALL